MPNKDKFKRQLNEYLTNNESVRPDGENHKMIHKSLGVTNATKLVTSRPIALQMKNARRKVKRKDLMKEELRKPTLHGMTMIHPMVQKRRLIF